MIVGDLIGDTEKSCFFTGESDHQPIAVVEFKFKIEQYSAVFPPWIYVQIYYRNLLMRDIWFDSIYQFARCGYDKESEHVMKRYL